MDAAIQKLIRGFGRFRTRYFETEQTLYRRLTQQGQSPQIMVIACCDARVDPALITDSDPGDLFVVRNVANLVPPQETGGHYHGTSAAIEFAVRSLRVRHVIVLGHARCGGIHALLQGHRDTNASGQYIQPWMAIADEARTVALAAHGDPSSDAAQRACEQAAIRVSLRNLRTFSWIRERTERGELTLHGWYFDIEQGQLMRFAAEHDGFVPFDMENTPAALDPMRGTPAAIHKRGG